MKGRGPAPTRRRTRPSLVGEGRLTAPSEPERSELATAIAAMLDARGGDPAGGSRPLLIRGVEEDHLLAVYVLPLVFPSANPVDRLFASARAVVVAIEATADNLEPSVVRDLLGLTRRGASGVAGRWRPPTQGGRRQAWNYRGERAHGAQTRLR